MAATDAACADGGQPAAQPGDAEGDAAAELASVALPAAMVRRIVRGAAPNVVFSSEALAAMNRVVQAYLLWATDRSLAKVRGEGARKKQKGRSAGAVPGAAGKRLTAEGVMAFLEAELPLVATKVSNLFPELMPEEHKPAAIRLLEKFREQEAARWAASVQAERAAAPEAKARVSDKSATGAQAAAVAGPFAPRAAADKHGPPAKKRRTAKTESVVGAQSLNQLFGRAPAPAGPPEVKAQPAPQVQEERQPAPHSLDASMKAESLDEALPAPHAPEIADETQPAPHAPEAAADFSARVQDIDSDREAEVMALNQSLLQADDAQIPPTP